MKESFKTLQETLESNQLKQRELEKIVENLNKRFLQQGSPVNPKEHRVPETGPGHSNQRKGPNGQQKS